MHDPLRHARMTSPVGPLLLAADDTGLRRIIFEAVEPAPQRVALDAHHPVLVRAVAELRAYFDGALRGFTVPLAPVGSAFDRRVWAELCRIDHGQTISYGELARRIGRPTASRAVGGANGRNPIPILIPCHRVLAANGALGGYSSGLPIKRALLELEHADLFVPRPV